MVTSLVFYKLKNTRDYDHPVDGVLKSENTDKELLRKIYYDDPSDGLSWSKDKVKSY